MFGPMISPCIDICMIDPRTSLCLGCGRTLDEVAAWGTMAGTERARIMQALPARMQAAGLPDLAAPGKAVG
ncbi:MAG: DUF1289 domain-containing protein [Pseudolabrys sp.]|nr:DUF1289 domain-containing protein [Pseudolabrys sp.]